MIHIATGAPHDDAWRVWIYCSLPDTLSLAVAFVYSQGHPAPFFCFGVDSCFCKVGCSCLTGAKHVILNSDDRIAEKVLIACALVK